MIVNILVIITLLLNVAMWGSRSKGRGLFSSFLNMLCVLVAGGLALAVWEPAANMLVPKLPDFAWCLGLLVPFAVILVVIRQGLDALVTKNMDFDDITNFVGGAVFGLGTGVITSGLIVLGISSLRVGPSLLGYQPIAYENGSPVYSGRLWVPTDRWTVGLYEKLSVGAFENETPLALRMPHADEQMAMMRCSYLIQQEAKVSIARTTVSPADFSVKGQYRLDKLPRAKLTEDTYNVTDGKPKPHDPKYPDGSSITDGDVLDGYIIEFKSGAFEKSGQLVLGPGQIRLVCKLPNGTAIGVHPVAVIAPPEAGGAYFRFRFDAPDVFIPSVGGSSSATFAVEFVIPKDAVPTDLIFRNARVDVPAFDLKNSFASAAKRDEAVKNSSIFNRFGAQAAKVAGSGDGGAKTVDLTQAKVITTAGANRFDGIEIGDTLPDGMVLNAGDKGGLDIADNTIIDGRHVFPRISLTSNRGIDRNLRVDKFGATKDTSIIKVTLANKGAMSLLGQSVETAENVLPPLLTDADGGQYEAIGFIYDDGTNVTIRFTPGEPLRGLVDLPSALSRSKRDQTAILLFRVTKGESILGFGLSSKVLAKFEPPLKVPK